MDENEPGRQSRFLKLGGKWQGDPTLRSSETKGLHPCSLIAMKAKKPQVAGRTLTTEREGVNMIEVQISPRAAPAALPLIALPDLRFD